MLKTYWDALNQGMKAVFYYNWEAVVFSIPHTPLSFRQLLILVKINKERSFVQDGLLVCIPHHSIIRNFRGCQVAWQDNAALPSQQARRYLMEQMRIVWLIQVRVYTL